MTMTQKSTSKTLIIQSQTQPLPFSWLGSCIDSVVSWCKSQDYEYRFYGDELFDFVDSVLIEKFAHQKVIITDLARLAAIKESLIRGYDRVLWLDSDFLIFAPEQFQLPALWNLPEGYMVGREVWVQAVAGKPLKWKAHVKVHNAFLLFDRGNSFLDFYTDQAERFIRQCSDKVPPQFIGPKLLTALHNVIQCPVMESAGMFSPGVIQDLISNGQDCKALELMKKRSSVPVAGANLCSSLTEKLELSNQQMELVVKTLLADRTPI